MQITKAQRREALGHADPLVRDEILRITERFRDNGLEITRTIQAAIDRYGIDKGFPYPHRLTAFTLDEETASWVLQQIQSDTTVENGENWRWHYARWLQNKAPLPFITKHRKDLLSQLLAPGLYPDEEVESRFDDSIAIRALTPTEAHNRLRAHCTALTANMDFSEADWQTVEQLIPRLEGGDDSIKETIIAFLKNKDHRPDENNPKDSDWLYEPYLNAAGYLQIPELVPILLDSLLLDWESINDDTPIALAQIGTDETVNQVTDFYRRHLAGNAADESDESAPNTSHIPLFLTRFFEHLDSDLAAAKAAELLHEDKDFMNRCCLAGAVASTLDGRHMPQICTFWKEHEQDADANDLVGPLYAHAILSGQEPAELPRWRKILVEIKKSATDDFSNLFNNFENLLKQPLNFGSTSAQPKPPKPERERTYWKKPEVTAGRNDPCPCGSGKKFKKCCMN